MNDAPRPDRPKRWTRRRLLRALTAAAAVGVGADAVWWEPGRLVVEPHTLFFPDLPPGLEGIRVAQLSDMHRSSVVAQAEVERAVALTNALAPELVLLTGDYVSRGSRYAEPCAAALAGLRAPLGRIA